MKAFLAEKGLGVQALTVFGVYGYKGLCVVALGSAGLHSKFRVWGFRLGLWSVSTCWCHELLMPLLRDILTVSH